MSVRISRRQALAGFGAAGLGSVAAARFAEAQEHEHESAFPLPGTVGFVRGQLARLSIVHHDHGKIAIPPTCNIVASILGSDGAPLITEKFANLGPNEARFVDFPHPGGRGKLRNTRLEILDLVRFTPGHDVGSTLQIIDLATGVTTLIPPVPCNFPDPSVGGEAGGHEAEAFPHSGTVGVVRGQVLRMSLTHHEHVPNQIPPICNIVAEVFDAGGKLVASETFQDLKGHESVFFDLPHPGGNGARRNTRVEWSLHVRHTPGHAIGASGQLIDAVTGVTTLLWPPICNFPDPTL